MSHGILLALTEGEAEVVRAIDAPGSGARVVRRCADLPELLGGVGAGIGTVAVVGSRVDGVDRASIGRLVAAGARVLLVGPAAEAGRLAQLGAHAVAAESDEPGTLAAMAIALARGENVRGRPGERVPGRPGDGAAGPGGHAPDGDRPPPAGLPTTVAVPDSVPEAWTREGAGGPRGPSAHGGGSGSGAGSARRSGGDAGSGGGDEAAPRTPERPTSRRALHRPDAPARPALGEDAGPDGAATPSEAGRPDAAAGGTAAGSPSSRPADQASPEPTSPEPTSQGSGASGSGDPGGDTDDAVISEVPWWLSSGGSSPTVPAPTPPAGTPEEVVDEAGPPPVIEPEEAPGRIVVVWGARGAPGRTTLAVNLAAEAAALGVRAVVVDADTEAPALAQVLGIPDDISSIAAVTRHATHGRLDADVARSALAEVSDNLRALTGLTRPDRWRELETASLESVWEVLREVAPLVVVDVAAGAEQGDGTDFGPVRHQATLSALAAADEVVVVGAGDPVGVRRLVLALTDLRERDLAPDARRSVVVNRVRRAAAGPDHERAVREALWRYGGDQEPVLVPDDPSTADAALLAGATWREQSHSSAARKAVEALARRVLDLPAGSTTRSRWWRRGARPAPTVAG
ncbi:hypothetical protein ACPYO6_09210 [Georgenia sp. Z1344]|uniref:AAA family ATPase n=1 Tax=Georgenia sp. Z1344 TaxID=3416706 RepID=UPI003CEDB174